MTINEDVFQVSFINKIISQGLVMLSARRSQEKNKTQTILYPESISKKSKSILPSHHSANSSSKGKFVPSHQREKSIRQRSGNSQKGIRSRVGSAAEKCMSQIEYRSGLGQPSSRNDVDRQTQINRVEDKSIKRQIQSELEHEEMVRQGLVKQNLVGQPFETEKNKIKIGSRFRRQLVAPVLQETKQVQLTGPNSSFAAKKAEQQEYDQIANDIRLNGLQSKVVNIPKVSSKAESFLSVLPQSESSIINTPGAAKNNIKNRNLSPDARSQTQPFRIPQSKLLDNLHLPEPSENRSRSLLSVGSSQQKAINKSVSQAIEGKMTSSKQVQINIHDGKSHPNQNKIYAPIVKNPQFEQSMVMIATKPAIAKEPSIRTARSRRHMLAIISQVLSFSVKGEDKNKEEIQKEKLNEELIQLRKTVRELRLEKIKAKADKNQFYESMHGASRTISYDNEQARHRYEVYDSQLGCENSEKGSSNSKEGRLYFGKIRKNRSISRQKSNSNYRPEQLSYEKLYEVPPLINIHKLKNQRFAASEQKASVLPFPEAESISKQYKTMCLERITEQNLEESMKFSAPLATSINVNYYRSNLVNNKVNIRGQQICENVLNKFQSNDRKFKTFIKRQSSKNRLKTNKSHAEETVNLINNPEISKQPTQFAASVSQEQIFEGTIVRNFKKSQLAKSEKSDNSHDRFMNNQNYELIKEGQNIQLTKRQIEFSETQIPPFSQIPNQHTSNEQLMDLVLTILPLSNQQYNEEEMTECTLKKYKNCIMFQLSPNSNFRIVWHFTGKLYFGQWDSTKNEKNGFGVEYFKNKFYYKGGFNNGKKEGNGIIINCNGSIYEGQWINGEKEGYGKQYNSEQISYYEGSWSHSKKEGHGHYQYSENEYQGTFENNLKSGFGIEIFENGDKYIGQYLRGKFHGEGKYIWRIGAFYLGQFSEGFKQGYGKWQSNSNDFDLYQGEYHKDKKHGHGKYAWSNRCLYEGLFENDLKHGIGSIQYPDGRYMQGVWTLGILTQVISKVSQAHKEEPLEQPKIRSHTRVAMRLAGPTLKH